MRYNRQWPTITACNPGGKLAEQGATTENKEPPLQTYHTDQGSEVKVDWDGEFATTVTTAANSLKVPAALPATTLKVRKQTLTEKT